MGIRAAIERQRDRISGGECMFPGQRTVERAPEVFDPQSGEDGTSIFGGDRPLATWLPFSPRPAAIQLLSAIEPRWGYGIDDNWDGQPLTFMPGRVVNPRVNLGYNPFVHYPTISRGHPIPYGNTIPALGET